MTDQLIYLDFEKEVKNLDQQIKELAKYGNQKGISFSSEVHKLEKKRIIVLSKIYKKLSGWQTVQIARHPQRPVLQDYLDLIVHDFRELHGDKIFGDDKAIITGFGKIRTKRVLIVGHNKGKNTKENITRNFGCPHPEGYRKALCKMKFAEKFNIPIICFIDTPGAYPGIGAEERGQAHAIATNLFSIIRLKVPIICIIIGEGGSGGALGIGIGDRIAMLEYSYYSVISPEGCAAILWRDGTKASEAAESLKLRSSDILKLGMIDDIISEPLGGAHRSIHDTVYNVERYIVETLVKLNRVKIGNLVTKRDNFSVHRK